MVWGERIGTGAALLTVAEMDRGERRAGQDGSHGEEGRAGRDHRHAQVIAPAAAHRHK